MTLIFAEENSFKGEWRSGQSQGQNVNIKIQIQINTQNDENQNTIGIWLKHQHISEQNDNMKKGETL